MKSSTPLPAAKPGFRENSILRAWRAGETVVNGWLSMPSIFSAEVMANQGWDSLTIDLQHGVVDYQMAVSMLTAISTTATPPIVRVPWLDPAIIMKVLDAGAYGLICPMINTREDAERLVSYCRYHPRGVRSIGPTRALVYAGADYLASADDSLPVFAMIETARALDNLDDILSVEGLTAVYVGPSDLAQTIGCKAQLDSEEAPMLDAIKRIADAATGKGVVPGIHTNAPAYAARMIELGYRFVTLSTDTRLLIAGTQRVLAGMRDLLR